MFGLKAVFFSYYLQSAFNNWRLSEKKIGELMRKCKTRPNMFGGLLCAVGQLEATEIQRTRLETLEGFIIADVDVAWETNFYKGIYYPDLLGGRAGSEDSKSK